MASFKSWMHPSKRRMRRIKAGYQKLYNDAGNWSSGKVGKGALIGTNRSIAAPTLISWRKRPVNAQEMQDLTIIEAMQIYKAKYWDAIKGDSIKSQALADLLADMKSSAGGNAVRVLQRSLNSLGYSLRVDGAFGNKSLGALNSATEAYGEAKIFNAFRSGMIEYYKSLKSPFEHQWISSLNKDYPPKKESIFSFPDRVKNGVAVILFVLALLAFLNYGKDGR